MSKNSPNKNDPTSSPLMELLKKYTTKVDERETVLKEGTRTSYRQQKNQTDETINKLSSKTSSTVDSNQQLTNISEDKTNINYKTKWEEAELKYRQLEKKYHQLETNTIKQLQDKVNQLQQECNQIKVMKESIAEICSCRHLTNTQLEQLKLLVKNNTNISIEPIANKNDFHHQTIKLRDILVTHNNELLNKVDDMLKKKRKRDQYENDLTDNDDKNH